MASRATAADAAEVRPLPPDGSSVCTFMIFGTPAARRPVNAGRYTGVDVAPGHDTTLADRHRLIADTLSGLVKEGRRSAARRGRAELIAAPGTTEGQVEETSSDLALRTSERVTGIEPA